MDSSELQVDSRKFSSNMTNFVESWWTSPGVHLEYVEQGKVLGCLIRSLQLGWNWRYTIGVCREGGLKGKTAMIKRRYIILCTTCLRPVTIT